MGLVKVHIREYGDDKIVYVVRGKHKTVKGSHGIKEENRGLDCWIKM